MMKSSLQQDIYLYLTAAIQVCGDRQERLYQRCSGEKSSEFISVDIVRECGTVSDQMHHVSFVNPPAVGYVARISIFGITQLFELLILVVQ